MPKMSLKTKSDARLSKQLPQPKKFGADKFSHFFISRWVYGSKSKFRPDKAPVILTAKAASFHLDD